MLPNYSRLKKNWATLRILERASLIGEILQDDLSSGAQRSLARRLASSVKDEATIRLYLQVNKLEPKWKDQIRRGRGMRAVLKDRKRSQAEPPITMSLSNGGSANSKQHYKSPDQTTLQQASALGVAMASPPVDPEDLSQALITRLKKIVRTSGAAQSLLRSLRLHLEESLRDGASAHSNPALYDAKLEEQVLTWLRGQASDPSLLLHVVSRAERECGSSAWGPGIKPRTPQIIPDPDESERAIRRQARESSQKRSGFGLRTVSRALPRGYR